MAKLSEIAIYPVKSMAGQRLLHAQVSHEGLFGDRRFMVVKPNGDFITARTHPRLLNVTPKTTDQQTHKGELWLSADGLPDLRIGAAEFTKMPIKTGVWKDSFTAQSTHPKADEWISAVLGEKALLLWLGETSNRFRENINTAVSFADGFPLLLIGEASLSDLNLRADSLNQMSQFRPNLVVNTEIPFEEDTWKRIRIGTVEFLVAKPCSRCIMTTVMPDSLRFNPQQEPLTTLSKYRKSMSGDVNFGQNLVALNEGEICLGDHIEVLETQEPEHYRSLAPAKRALQLIEKRAIANDFYQLSFSSSDSKPLPSALSGQHLVFAFDINGTRHIRRYSLTHPTGDGLYHIAVKRTQKGLISNHLIDNLTGDSQVLCGRPEGHFTPKVGTPLLLLGAGSGITPMLAIIRAAFLHGKRQGSAAPLSHIHLIYQCRTKDDIPEPARLKEWVLAGMTLEIWLSRPEHIQPITETNDLEHLPIKQGRWAVNHLEHHLLTRDVFICGPQGFMDSATKRLIALGADEAKIVTESFGMAGSDTGLPAKSLNIEFDGQTFTGSNQLNLLSQVEARGLVIPWSCRAGICGTCKCELLDGEVAQPKSEALSKAERDRGVVLACSAIPLTDLKLRLSTSNGS